MSILLTKKQAAEHLGFSVRYLEGLMHNGTGPRFLKMSRTMVRFRMDDLDQWAKDQPSYTGTSQVA